MSNRDLKAIGFLLCIKINNIHDISIASVMDGTNSLMSVNGAEGVSLHWVELTQILQFLKKWDNHISIMQHHLSSYKHLICDMGIH